jgi:DNA-binding transcriptional regulator PaaX
MRLYKPLSQKALQKIARNYRDADRLPVQTIVLRLLYIAGVMGAAVMMPNAVQLLRYIDPTLEKDRRTKQRIYNALSHLRAKKLIHVEDGTYELTSAGESKIETILSGEYCIPEPVLWDGKWRVIMFDIPEKKRRVREMLRPLLSHAGFLRLQDSVWIHPYPCDEFLTLIRTHLKNTRGELQYLTADFFDSDKALRRHFGL